jgi:glycine oxidase
MDVLIAGGGVIGCSIAYSLQRAGAQVTLVERGHLAAGASSAAAGMLAPLAENTSTGPLGRLTLAGLKAFHERTDELIAESGIDFEFRREGILRVAETADDEAELRMLLKVREDGGPELEWLDEQTLRKLEPALGPSVIGALHMPGEGHVHPCRLTAALAAAAARRGTRILEGWPVEGLEREGTRVVGVRGPQGSLQADRMVLAGGAWLDAGWLAPATRIPVSPVRGQMAAVQCTPAPIGRTVYSHSGYLVPKPDGSIWIGATEEHTAGFDASVTLDGLHWLLGAAKRLVPALSSALYLRSWAGLRPCAPDRLPILGPLPGADNVFVAGAHFRNGILLSLITGQLMCELLVSGVIPKEMIPFLPGRFTTGSS